MTLHTTTAHYVWCMSLRHFRNIAHAQYFTFSIR